MPMLFRSPWLLALVSLLAYALSAQLGFRLRARYHRVAKEDGDDYALVVGGALTLLALIIGFTFSMAVGRYDQRKAYEEQEANAIGTAYVRADLLPPERAAQVRAALRAYLDQRIRWYTTSDGELVARIDAETGRLQAELWSAVAAPAVAQPTPVAALVVNAMNDVLNSQGYTQAAWWNRIPPGAWALLVSIGIFCNLLLGYRLRERSAAFSIVLPIALAITTLLVSDIDTPRRGMIRVVPQNLQATAASIAEAAPGGPSASLSPR